MSHSTPRSERTLLLSYLNDQRTHVLGMLDGLDEKAPRRPVLPSGWSCLGLLQHLAIDIERFWFRCVVAADQTAIASLAGVGNAWEVAPDASAASIIALYREEIATSALRPAIPTRPVAHRAPDRFAYVPRS